MSGIVVFGVVAVLTAGAFVLAPLLREEADLQPLDRPRPGVRDLDGATADERTRDGAVVRRGRCCPGCGRSVERAYDFCGDCVRPLPE